MGSLPEEKMEKKEKLKQISLKIYFYYLNHFKIKLGFL